MLGVSVLLFSVGEFHVVSYSNRAMSHKQLLYHRVAKLSYRLTGAVLVTSEDMMRIIKYYIIHCWRNDSVTTPCN